MLLLQSVILITKRGTMQTECISGVFGFEEVDGKKVAASFDGGAITSDAGALLLGLADRAIDLTGRFAACFRDTRTPELVVHDLETLVFQRLAGIALGYEDVNDHDHLRFDPVMAVLAGKLKARRKDCAPLAGKSTLNRLEHAPSREGVNRYHKISHDADAIRRLFTELFIEAHKAPPFEIVLDLDATDDPLHGDQEGKFFHGYYKGYCYLPLYVFCGRHLLAAELRTADRDAAAGSKEILAPMVARIRQSWPGVRIIVRGDSVFAREELMCWCEENGVDYLLGLARNARLEKEIGDELAQAKAAFEETREAARCFRDFMWSTKDSWSARRRVVAKAEHLEKGANPRFVVTSLSKEYADGKTLYEKHYCARGEMENRIKECQLDLFADRTSTATMKANQLRLWLSSMAYVLVDTLRRIGLAGTEMANATCGTIRLRLLKIGALVKTSVRRIKIAMASGCPYQDIYAAVHARLMKAGRRPEVAR
jgi:hypothetical protein